MIHRAPVEDSPDPHLPDLSPAARALQQRYELLQEEFGKLIEERDLLINTIIPGLETEYQVK